MLLGELQFAFVAFLVSAECLLINLFIVSITCYYQVVNVFKHMQMGQSLEAFLQWKALVNLLFGCTEAVSIGLSSTFHLTCLSIQ